MVASRKATRFVLRPQPGDVVAEVLCGDLAHINVFSDLGHPQIEHMFVTEERVGAETFRRFVLQKAEEGF
jgi:hypothetical protein